MFVSLIEFNKIITEEVEGPVCCVHCTTSAYILVVHIREEHQRNSYSPFRCVYIRIRK